MLDKFGFKLLAIINLILTLVLSSTLSLVTDSQTLYMIYVICVYFGYGGIFVLIPTLCAKLYGI